MITQNQIIQKAIDTYGVPAQLDQLHEEIGELMQALNKVKRKGGVFAHHILKPNTSTDTKYSQLYYDLCSEVADVKIMLRQLSVMLDQEAINLAYVRKIERLNDRLGVDKRDPRNTPLTC